MVKKTTPKRLTTADLFRTVYRYADAQKAEASARKLKSEAQADITTELERRKIKSLSSEKFGPFVRVTFVQNEHMEYDEDGLWSELNATQRRAVFDRYVNLNELSAAARKKVIDVLTKEELDSVTSWSLDVDKLSEQVQARKIRSRLVAKFASLVKSAPYIRVSWTEGEK